MAAHRSVGWKLLRSVEVLKTRNFDKNFLKKKKLNLLRITAWFRVVKQIESIWLFNRLLYYHSVTFYILMTAWKNLKKLNEEKLKICKRKLIFGETWKTWKKEETWISKVDFVHDWQPRITSAIVDNHDNVRFWLSSMLLSLLKGGSSNYLDLNLMCLLQSTIKLFQNT